MRPSAFLCRAIIKRGPRTHKVINPPLSMSALSKIVVRFGRVHRRREKNERYKRTDRQTIRRIRAGGMSGFRSVFRIGVCWGSLAVGETIRRRTWPALTLPTYLRKFALVA